MVNNKKVVRFVSISKCYTKKYLHVLLYNVPIFTSKRFAHPAKIPSVTTSPREDAIGQAILSISY
jgi:hypothetical protein